MSSKHQDLWLWTFLGVFGFYAARAVHIQLRAMRAAAQITKIDRSEDNVTKGVENVLKIETLWQLTRSSNQEIRAASIKIITDRVSQGTTYDLILEDIAGEDSKRRERGLTCLNFLSSCPGKLPDPLLKTYEAIFACLRSLYSEMYAFERATQENFNTTGPGTSRRNGNRKKPSRDALNILASLLQHNSRDAVRAGLVSWLADYPFGGFVHFIEGRRETIAEITSWYYEDPAMYTILSFAKANSESLEQLVKLSLVDKAQNSFESLEMNSELVWSGHIGVESVFSPTMRGGRRVREESAEEQALRRRRREAMVLGADIIERRNTGQEGDEIGREQEEPVAEIHEDEPVRDWSWWNWRPW